MSTTIHLLSQEQAQKIAAGEVVERPANIVKELVENSIDAGATNITISIKKAGKNLIRITDDGSGMSSEDAVRCFARHATSKLTSVDQLMSLNTFGFRGEALASISAVSKVELTTRTAHNKLGTRVLYEHGIQKTVESIACPVGTTLTITQLFATIPVRKAFLKQDETEWNQIVSALTGLALTHQNCSFKIIKDETTYVHAPSVTSLRDRITQLWGHNLTQQLREITPRTKDPISISGMLSMPPFARYGKQQVVLFVNKRLVKNSDLIKAVLKGYKQSLPPGKYPAAVLFITVDAEKVDVNIHPRKEEVRFTQPGVVSRVIQETIIRSLEHGITQRLQPSVIKYAPKEQVIVSTLPSSPNQARGDNPARHPDLVSGFTKKIWIPDRARSDGEHIKKNTSQIREVVEPVTTTPPRIIGQLFATYIIIEHNDELILVDQHAAHERILYHQFANKFENKEGTTLLFPETITLHESALAAIEKYTDFFAQQGITLHRAGPTQIAVTSSPPKLQKESLAELIKDAANFIQEHESLDHEQFMRRLNEHVHSHMSCKAAVRAGDRLNTQTMQSLVEQLMRTPNRFMCVHGRPTMLPLERAELEKKFRRR